MNQRNILPDISKGVLILLVLLGHSIQFASGSDYLTTGAFYGHWTFKLIYGFHMPCFMVISGYLFPHAIASRKVKEIIVGKIRTLLVPIFSFAFIVWLCYFNQGYSFFDQIRNYLSRTRFTLWFLWAMFYSSMGVLLVNKVFKDSFWVYLLLIFLSLLTPDRWYSELYKFIFPCFLFGYYAHKGKWADTFRKHAMVIAGVTLPLYVLAMFLYYDIDTYVYMSGCCVLVDGVFQWHQLFIDVYRVVVGICGTIAFMTLLYLVCKSISLEGRFVKAIAWLGTMTMGIYCFQDFFWRLYVEHITWLVKPIFFNHLLLLLVSLVVSLALTWVARRVKVLNILFLGGR